MKKWIELLKKRKTAMTIAAILVVFVTTYTLILPALTIEKSTASEEAGIVLDQEAENEADAEAVTAEKDTAQSDTAVTSGTTADQKADTEKAAEDSEETSATEEDADEIAMPAQNFEKTLKKEGITVYVKAEEGALPEGTKMEVEAVSDPATLEKITDEAEKEAGDNTEIGNVQAVDISFWNDGEEIEPEENVYVTIASDLIKDTNEQMIIHVNDEDSDKVADSKKGKAEVVKAMTEKQLEKKNITPAEDEIVFEADQFSVYGIVGTETISTQFKASDNSTYEVTVNYDEKAGIPADAKLLVEEVTQSDEDYDTYLKQTAEAIDGRVFDFNYIKLLDISIVDQNGNKVALDASVDVQIRLLDTKRAEETTQVVHFGENTEVMDTTVDGDTVSFSTGGFSIYAVVDDPADGYARMTLEFYNGTTLIDSMIVKVNDTADDLETIIYDPGVGTLADGTVFRGWWVVASDANSSANYTVDDVDSAKTIADVRTWALKHDITNGETIKIYAMIYKNFVVSYLDSNNVTLVADNVLLLADATSTTYTVSQTYTPDDDTLNFEGWNVYSGSSYITNYVSGTLYQYGDSITISGDVTFSVEQAEGHWLVFNENGKGATYNAPVFVKSGSVTTKPCEDSAMVRYGYTFGGWYTDADCTTEFTFGNELTDNKTIYAKWVENTTAPFTVLIWKQNTASIGSESLTADDYDFAASYVGTGTVGSSIVDSAITIGTAGDLNYATIGGTKYGGVTSVSSGTTTDPFTGFTLNTSITDATITSDGTAVVNVYFDRVQYTLKLYLAMTNTNTNRTIYGSSQSGTGGYGGNWSTSLSYITRINGSAPTTYDTVGNYRYYYYPITAYYGQSISSVWPLYSNITSSTSFVSWILMTTAKAYVSSTAGQNTVKGTIGIMDEQVLGDLSDTDGNYLIARYSSRYNAWTYYIYMADADGNYPSSPTYTLELRSQDSDGAQQHAPAYDGYTNVALLTRGTGESSTVYSDLGVTPTGYWKAYFYTPNTYNILFMDGQYVDGNGNAVQNKSTNVLDTEENIAMGASTASYNEYEPTLPSSEEGYVFEGWYMDSACTQAYTFTTMPMGGITVYAKWRQIQYRVFLHPNVPETDSSLYWGRGDQAMNFRISYGGTVSAPTGTRSEYEFINWYLDEACTQVFNADSYILNDTTVTDSYDKETHMTDEMNIYGNIEDESSARNSDLNRFWITKELNIYAKWRHILIGADGIGINYSLVDTSYDPSVTGTNAPNDTMQYLDQAEAAAQPACTAPEGYVFSYWVVQEWDSTSNAYVDTNTIVYPGDTFIVYSDYAQVTKNEDSTEEDPSYTYTMQLRAHYVPEEEETPTYINWYGNNETSTTDGTSFVVTDNNLQINGAIAVRAATTFSYEGHTFLGWARINTSDTDGTDLSPTLESSLSGNSLTTYNGQALTEDNLFLKWNATYDNGDGTYGAFVATNNTLGATAGTKVSYVAPDETMPYQAMVAVWEVNTYEVTIKKVVDGTETDKTTSFKIAYDYDDTSLTDGSVSLTNGNSQTVSTQVPYGTVIKVSESNVDYFNVGFSAVRTTDAAGTELYEDDYVTTSSDTGEFTITGNTTITVTNTRAKQDVVFEKTLTAGQIDDDSADITTAGFTLTDTTDNAITYKTSPTSDGTVTFTGVAVGTYTLSETTVPTGYAAISDYTVTVTKTGYTITLGDDEMGTNSSGTYTVSDPLGTTSIKLVKTNTEGTTLSGATFKLTAYNGSSYVEIGNDYNSITAGTTTISGLSVGTKYCLTETKAPDGHLILENPHYFQIKLDGTVELTDADGSTTATLNYISLAKGDDGTYTITVQNETGQALPHTGGPGTLLYTLSGIALMLGAALMYGFRLRRRERRLKN